MSRWGEGRKPIGARALSQHIDARVTESQRIAYLQAGGADWLRTQLQAEIVRQRLTPAPTAHNPFPAFTVTDAKTGEPVPHTVTVRELLMTREFIIVSYGAGTNSTAILVGLRERGIVPDAITFADTGGEKPHTYAHLGEVNLWCLRNGFPPIDVLIGPMPQQQIDGSLENECLRLGKLPAKAYGFSSCSDKWKMEPQRRYNARFAEQRGITQSQIVRLIGFDADEHSRVERGLAMAEKKATKERYPLYEWGWGRDECIAAISRAGLPQPGKSACFFCPSSKKPEIIELASRYPDLAARALEMERRAHAGEGRAPATTSAGLGRYFSWASVIAAPDIHKNDQVAPEVDCGCYDGD